MAAYGWTPEYVRSGITGAQGWAYYFWALENEMTIWGAAHERRGDGYVAQERKRIANGWTRRNLG